MIVLVAALSIVASILAPGTAAADEIARATGPDNSAARIDHIDTITDRRVNVFVDSPSMRRLVPVEVLLPPDRDAPRPSLYMLDGVEAAPDENTWTKETDIVDFFADKEVNVVLPAGGKGSFYADWHHDDPTLGRNQWETFLTKELPNLIDGAFNGNGMNGIAGLSMGAHAAMSLTTRHPELYQAVAAYSGCMATSDDSGQSFIRLTVEYEGGDPGNMWGPPTDPDWAGHDPLVNADKLRGKEIYMSVGNGLPTPTDDHEGRPTEAAAGFGLEVAARYCTALMDNRLKSLDIPATVSYRQYGLHDWTYWQQDLHDSWPVLARALLP